MVSLGIVLAILAQATDSCGIMVAKLEVIVCGCDVRRRADPLCGRTHRTDIGNT